MKNIYLITILFICSLTTSAQTFSYQSNNYLKQYRDTTNRDVRKFIGDNGIKTPLQFVSASTTDTINCKTIKEKTWWQYKLPTKPYRKLLAADVSNIISGDPSLGNTGSYASINIDKLQASITGATLLYKQDGKAKPITASLNFNGGAIDNVVEMFSGGKISYEFSGRLDLNFFLVSKYKFSDAVWNTAIDELCAYESKINGSKYDAIKANCDVMAKLNADTNRCNNNEYTQEKIDKINYINNSYTQYLDSFDVRRQDSLDAYFISRLPSPNNTFHFWFNLFGSISGQSFYLHNLLLPFGDQVYKKTFLGAEAGGAFNLYYRSSDKTKKWLNGFARLSLSYIRDNNKDYDNLTNFKTTTTIKDSTGNFSRQFSEEQKSYPDSTYYAYHGFRFQLDVYKNIINSSVSLHGFIKTETTKKLDIKDTDVTRPGKSKPSSVDMGIGLLFGLPKKDDVKKIVTFEPVVTFQDLTDKYYRDLKIKNRIKVEVRLSLPLNYFALPNTK